MNALMYNGNINHFIRLPVLEYLLASLGDAFPLGETPSSSCSGILGYALGPATAAALALHDKTTMLQIDDTQYR